MRESIIGKNVLRPVGSALGVHQSQKSHEDSGDAAYWVTKSPQQRLAAVEEIRTEYIQWKFGAQSRLQRVYRVVKSS